MFGTPGLGLRFSSSISPGPTQVPLKEPYVGPIRGYLGSVDGSWVLGRL